MKRTGLKIEPCGTPGEIIPNLKKNQNFDSHNAN